MIKSDGTATSGTDRERQRARRYWLMMIGPVAFALLAGFAFNALYGVDDIRLGQISPARALLGLFITAVMLPLSIVLHHKIADEQEKQALLWSTHVAFLFVVTSGASWWFLNKALLVPPVNFMALVGATSFLGTAIWLWLKYR